MDVVTRNTDYCRTQLISKRTLEFATAADDKTDFDMVSPVPRRWIPRRLTPNHALD